MPLSASSAEETERAAACADSVHAAACADSVWKRDHARDAPAPALAGRQEADDRKSAVFQDPGMGAAPGEKGHGHAS